MNMKKLCAILACVACVFAEINATAYSEDEVSVIDSVALEQDFPEINAHERAEHVLASMEAKERVDHLSRVEKFLGAVVASMEYAIYCEAYEIELQGDPVFDILRNAVDALTPIRGHMQNNRGAPITPALLLDLTNIKKRLTERYSKLPISSVEAAAKPALKMIDSALFVVITYLERNHVNIWG